MEPKVTKTMFPDLPGDIWVLVGFYLSIRDLTQLFRVSVVCLQMFSTMS